MLGMARSTHPVAYGATTIGTDSFGAPVGLTGVLLVHSLGCEIPFAIQKFFGMIWSSFKGVVHGSIVNTSNPP